MSAVAALRVVAVSLICALACAAPPGALAAAVDCGCSEAVFNNPERGRQLNLTQLFLQRSSPAFGRFDARARHGVDGGQGAREALAGGRSQCRRDPTQPCVTVVRLVYG
jgi:hypothetical protein